MPRLSSRLFTDLILMMVGLGLLIGLLFPFVAAGVGIADEQSLRPEFWVATSAAGLLVGAVNFAIARMVVRPRLRLLSERMGYVEQAIQKATYTGDWSDCTIERCRVPVDSEDELGHSARAFNDLVSALFRSHETSSAAGAFSNALSAELELRTLSAKALDLFLKHTGACAGAVLSNPGGELALLAHRGLGDPQGLLQSSRVRTALRGGTCVRVTSPEKMPLQFPVAAGRPHEAMLVPAVFNGVPVGLVVLASVTSFDPNIQWLLHHFRQHFGLALNNALVHDQLQRIAAVDPLTGIYNRRFGMTRLHEEFKRAVRTQAKVGVMMIDIDHFKRVNDTHGHLAGDRALAQVAEILSASFREEDIVIRYGGEEFLAVLPGAGHEDCQALAERVRVRVADTGFTVDGEIIRITVSVGVASYPDREVEHPRELVAVADRALYRAKTGGRNRVVHAS